MWVFSFFFLSTGGKTQNCVSHSNVMQKSLPKSRTYFPLSIFPFLVKKNRLSGLSFPLSLFLSLSSLSSSLSLFSFFPLSLSLFSLFLSLSLTKPKNKTKTFLYVCNGPRYAENSLFLIVSKNLGQCSNATSFFSFLLLSQSFAASLFLLGVGWCKVTKQQISPSFYLRYFPLSGREFSPSFPSSLKCSCRWSFFSFNLSTSAVQWPHSLSLL